MEPIRYEPSHLKHPAPQDDNDDENNTPSTHPPGNISNNMGIEPIPNLVQSE